MGWAPDSAWRLASAMTLIVGSRLGAYEIRGPIWKGRMGEVYRAHGPRLGRDIAIVRSPFRGHSRHGIRRAGGGGDYGKRRSDGRERLRLGERTAGIAAAA